MNLEIALPTDVVVSETVQKIIAETAGGSHCLLPRHADLVTELVPGIFSYVAADGEERFLALDRGVLVKCGPDVRIAARRAVLGPELGELRSRVRQVFERQDDREGEARDTLGRLAAGMVRHFLDSGTDARG